MSNLLLYPLEHANLEAQEKQKTDYIVVLACYYNTEGQIPEISRWSHCSLERLVEAVKKHKQTGAIIVLSGGKFLENKDVIYSEKAKHFLISLGVPPSKIISTKTGNNTQKEIRSIKYLIDNKNIVLITSSTHILRVSKELREITNFTDFVPVDYHSDGDLTPYLSLPSITALESTRLALYEYLALVKQAVD